MTTTPEARPGARRADPAPFPMLGRPRRSTRRPSTFWRIREEIPPRLRWALLVLSLAAPLLLWVLLRASGTVSPLYLPSIAEVVSAGRTWIQGDAASDVYVSVRRVTIGFGLAVLISVPLGLAIGAFRSIQSLFEPAISLVRYMPATAFIPLFIIWFGIGEEPKIVLILVGTVFFNTLMTANIVWQVPAELLHVSRTLGAGSFTVFRKVIFPYAVPGMIDAARVNLAAAWNLIVVAELFAAEEGLGFRIVRSQKFLQTDTIFAVLLVIGVLGLASDLGLRVLRDRVAPWTKEA